MAEGQRLLTDEREDGLQIRRRTVLLARRSMHAVETRFGSDLKESAEAMQAKADCMRTVKLYREDYTRGEIGSKSTYDTGLYDDRAMRR